MGAARQDILLVIVHMPRSEEQGREEERKEEERQEGNGQEVKERDRGRIAETRSSVIIAEDKGTSGANAPPSPHTNGNIRIMDNGNNHGTDNVAFRTWKRSKEGSKSKRKTIAGR